MTGSPQFARRTHPARDHLEAMGRRWPDAWELVDKIRTLGAKQWPAHVYLPIPAASAVITEQRNRIGIARATGGPIGHQARDACDLAALSAWRMTQGIYRFDPALYAALVDTPMVGDLPCSLFLRLPEWCVYIEAQMELEATGDRTVTSRGAWVWLDYDERYCRDKLLIQWDIADIPLPTTAVPLAGSIDDAVSLVIDQWVAGHASGLGPTLPPAELREVYARGLPPILSLVLYLCAGEPDISGKGRPGNPEPVRTRRGGWRLFAAQGVRTWDVGVRMGTALRRAYAAAEAGFGGVGEQASPRPHVRRSHWHGFWSGPKAGDRKFDVRWMPPIPVNLGDVDALPAVVRPVRS